MATKQSPRIPA